MEMTSGEYQEYRNEYDGYCSTCDEVIACGGVEPDAHGYQCDECSEPTLMGIEQALLEGKIEITE